MGQLEEAQEDHQAPLPPPSSLPFQNKLRLIKTEYHHYRYHHHEQKDFNMDQWVSLFPLII